MTTIRDLFAMSNEALMEAWLSAKLADVRTRYAAKMEAADGRAELARITEARGNEERKIEIETIRLVISFRLTNREAERMTAEPANQADE
jgi:hypothetical protein